MTDAKQQAEAVRRLVVDGVAPDNQTALDHVMNEERGRQIAARVNAQRGQAPQPKTEEPT